MENAHAFRSSSGFDGQLNFVGSAGLASVTHSDLTDANVVRHLAGRVTSDFFAIDGTTISTTAVYDGSNVAAINAELATLAVNGRFLQIDESGGTQTLNLVAVPEPSAAMFSVLAVLGMATRRRR